MAGSFLSIKGLMGKSQQGGRDDHLDVRSWQLGASIPVDVGSSNVKAARVGADGRLEASSDRPLHTTRDGDVAEQDAEALWRAVCEAVQEVADPSVQSVGVCSQYSSIVPVDEDLVPVAPLLM